MKLLPLTAAFVALLIGGGTMAVGAPVLDDRLLTAARKALPPKVSSNELAEALERGLWNSNKTAVAISIRRTKASPVFVFLRSEDGSYLASDISQVEGANIGFIGPHAKYERIETEPIQWLPREDGWFQIVVRTRAWRSGKRYTAAEPLIIRPDGTPLWR